MPVLKKLLLSLIFALCANMASAMFIQPDWLDPTEPGVGTNRYAYSGNDPINNMDPNGNFWGAVVKAAKFVFKGGDAAATFGGMAADASTVFSSDASGGERAVAALSLVTEIFSPVTMRDLKAAKKMVSNNSKTDRGGSIVTDTKGKDGSGGARRLGTKTENEVWGDGKTILEGKTSKGNSIERVDGGNKEQAHADFDSLELENYKEYSPDRRFGTLPGSGDRVMVRPSTDGRPTISIHRQRAGGKWVARREIRYGNPE